MIEIKKYRKRPVEIEAVQWDGTTDHAKEIITWIKQNGGTAHIIFEAASRLIAVSTLEGVMKARPHNYLIRGIAGEFYPHDEKIFPVSYEEI